MAGSKKNKQKKAPLLSQNTPEPPVDEDLMDDLFAQLDSRDQVSQAESAAVINEVGARQERANTRPKQDAKSRFKARQARKAAALEQAQSTVDPEADARLMKEAEDEQRDIDKVCHEQRVQIHEINPDGHCLYSAIADQLALLGILPASQANYAVVRQTASSYMLAHPDDFLPFLEPTDDGELLDTGVMTPKGFERYCATIRDTAEWGGEPEILALSRAYNIPIHVIQGGRPPIVTHDPGEARDTNNSKRVVRISYHRRMYGLGEHYNSLRPKSSALLQLSHKVQTILSS
ncbi:hypothetical protein H0H92_002645 [Tricholoma furcatifolium]|nr:hypothetical protein H0H92_002645 [Tricholoma furcatifolium]